MSLRIEILFLALLMANPLASAKDSVVVFCQDVSWSPDGKKLCFSAIIDGAPSELFLIAASGDSLVRLTKNDVSDQWSSWSPDTSGVIFMSQREGNSDLFFVKTDSSSPRKVTSGAYEETYPSFSPDGAHLVYSARSGLADDSSFNLYIRGLDGHDISQLTNLPKNEINAAWSPKGDLIAFCYDRGDRRDNILLINSGGGQPHQITHDTLNSIFPSWSHDGSRLIYCSTSAQGKLIREVHVISRDSTEAQELLPLPASTFFARYSPDGTKIACISGAWPKSDIKIYDLASRRSWPLFNSDVLKIYTGIASEEK